MEEESSSDSGGPSLQPLQAKPGITGAAGEVRTLSNQPLEGVTLCIGNQTTRTDDKGRFLLTTTPGRHVLLIDGRTAGRPGQVYGVFEIGIEARAGRTNILPFTKHDHARGFQIFFMSRQAPTRLSRKISLVLM
jgi:hypothetical protein